MNRYSTSIPFALGLAAVAWVAYGFIGSSWLALAMSLVIAGVYLLGAWELKQFRAATSTLEAALQGLHKTSSTPSTLTSWLECLPVSLQAAVRARVEGERVVLPSPSLTPYLVGLLVMLGMLGTFLGMVVTFKGAVFALEGSTDLQAIRSALAAPIKGLGLSFGTSVAGVAASAMLGLMSAISRRERMHVARLLDASIATVLRPFSRAHQRDESFKALQVQASVLPTVVDRLQTLMDHLDQRNQQLNEQLMQRQDKFHADVTGAYTALAASVGQSLNDSLANSARLAADTIQPMVQTAMSEIAQESARQQARVTDTFDQRTQALLRSVQDGAAQAQAAAAQADQQRLQAWSQTLQSTAASLHSDWQQVAQASQANQQTICTTLELTAQRISAGAAEQTQQAITSLAQLLEKSEAWVSSRITAESQWAIEQGARMDQLATLWRDELGALRNDEAARGQLAVDRLASLQDALATQLATLGQALEEPLSRLMHTASEAPRAAADLITQLRQEMARVTERDDLALDERAALMQRITAVLASADQTAGAQRSAIESLVGLASSVLTQNASQFTQLLQAQTDKASDMTAQVGASTLELAALGNSFQHALTLFNASNDKLASSLQRVELAIGQSMERSDEQLAYYVGQAREVIDLSLSSQKAVVEDLRQLHSRQMAQAESVL